MEPFSVNPWTWIAAMGGAISGLAFMPWETMTWAKRVLTVFVGFTCAIFVAPWLAHLLFGVKASAQQYAMATYATAVGSHIILPKVIQWLTRAFGGKS